MAQLFLDSRFLDTIAGTMAVFGLVCVPAQALSLAEIQAKATEITVKIQSDRPSSGVLVGRTGDRYRVLTTKHSVRVEDQYAVITPDGEFHNGQI